MYWGVQTGTWLAALQEPDASRLSVVYGSKHRSFAWTFSNQTNFINEVLRVFCETGAEACCSIDISFLIEWFIYVCLLALYKCTWCDNKIRELIAVKVLHNSLLNTAVVTFRVLPLGSYAPMPALVHSSKQFWNWFCGMAFRAVVVLLLMSSVSSKSLPFNISFIFGNRKESLGARSGE